MIKPNTKINVPISHLDWFPTIAGTLGDTDIKERLKAGTTFGSRSYKVHLDGYNFLPYFKGEVDESPRREFFYFSDTGNLLNLRYNNYKIVFAEQRAHGADVWSEPFVFLRMPRIFNIRSDPFERAQHEAFAYTRFWFDHLFVLVPAQVYVGRFLETFKEFPPRQTPASFSIDQVLAKMKSSGTN